MPRRIGKSALLAMALLSKVAFSAEPTLRCEIYEAGETHIVDTGLVSDPYTVKPVAFNRFRFKAVFVGTDKKIEYIKLYSYYRTKQQAVLVHQSKHTPPFGPPASFTGVNYVYSPLLGAEMQYKCSLSGLDQ